MSFQPIDPDFDIGKSCQKVSPVAIKRTVGVKISRYNLSELEELMRAGPIGSKSASFVEASIQAKRGGVLPQNWEYVKSVKLNIEAMDKIGL